MAITYIEKFTAMPSHKNITERKNGELSISIRNFVNIMDFRSCVYRAKGLKPGFCFRPP